MIGISEGVEIGMGWGYRWGEGLEGREDETAMETQYTYTKLNFLNFKKFKLMKIMFWSWWGGSGIIGMSCSYLVTWVWSPEAPKDVKELTPQRCPLSTAHNPLHASSPLYHTYTRTCTPCFKRRGGVGGNRVFGAGPASGLTCLLPSPLNC